MHTIDGKPAFDITTLDQLSAEFADAGHRFRALQRALVLHESFRVVAAPEDGEVR